MDSISERFQEIIDILGGSKSEKPIVIFIDDVDRCMPEKSLDVLEATRKLLDVKGCIFVISIDRSIVEKIVSLKYKDLPLGQNEKENCLNLLGQNYLEKLIQFPLSIPKLSDSSIRHLIEGLYEDEDMRKCIPIFVAGVAKNPRKIKRLLLVFNYLNRLAKERIDDYQSSIMAKLIIIENRYRELYNLILSDYQILSFLEKYFLRPEDKDEYTHVVADEDRYRKISEILSLYENLADLFKVRLSDGDSFIEIAIQEYIYLIKSVSEESLEKEGMTIISGQIEKPLIGILPPIGPLPPGSYIPHVRNADFAGRVEELLALADNLLYTPDAGSVYQAVAATGMGGIGKTQLAVEFCYRYGRFFQGVHWVQADQDMEAGIAACGAKMGLTPWPGETAEQVERTLAAWQGRGPRLVVLDNLEDEVLLKAWLPRLGGLRVLLTSRRAEWPNFSELRKYVLGSLPRAESLLLLRRLAPRLEQVADAELEALAEKVGDLPLALDLMGRYLHIRKTLSPGEYAQEIEKAGAALAHSSLVDRTTENPTGHENSMLNTFLLSWQAIDLSDETDRLAGVLFRACGYCAPNVPIPDNVLAAAAGQDEEGSEAFDFALRRLANLGLALQGEDGLLVQPLLAEFARVQDENAPESALPALVDALGTLSYQANETGLVSVFAPLRPHLQAAAEAAQTAGLEAAGKLWNNLGYHLHEVAEYHNAKAAYERALAIDKAAYGSDHPSVARDVNNLGSVLQALGDLPGAREAYERALAVDEAAFGSEHPSVAIRVNNLGSVLKDLGDLVGARAAYERALAIFEKHLGSDHPNVATLVNNLGGVLQGMGDLAGARAAYQRALAIDEAAYGSEHPSVARDVKDLGGVLYALGDLVGAREAFEWALAIFKKHLGADHPNVATLVNNLGGVLQALGDLAGARVAYERALAVDEAAFGFEHPSVARDVNNLGSVLQALGDLSGARAAFERALVIFEKQLGTDHPNVATLVNNLGGVLYALGDLAGARAAYERALAIFERFLPPDHPNIRIVRGNLERVKKEMEERGE